MLTIAVIFLGLVFATLLGYVLFANNKSMMEYSVKTGKIWPP